MRHRAKGRQLSRTSTHRRAMLNNMATSLFDHGRVITTEAKAKELRPFAEKLITLARRGEDRKSTRLNSSHLVISYAVFCLKKKINSEIQGTTVPTRAMTTDNCHCA